LLVKLPHRGIKLGAGGDEFVQHLVAPGQAAVREFQLSLTSETINSAIFWSWSRLMNRPYPFKNQRPVVLMSLPLATLFWRFRPCLREASSETEVHCDRVPWPFVSLHSALRESSLSVEEQRNEKALFP